MLNVDGANKTLTRKILLVWGVAIGLFFLSLTDLWFVGPFSKRIAEFFPVVRSQFDKQTPIGYLAGCYFGLAVALIPMASIFLLWGQDILTRAKVGVERSGGLWKYLFFVYLVGLPFCIFILGLVYFVPVEIPQNPRLFGQLVAHALTSTYPGLLIFGSILIVALTLFLFLLLSGLLLPFLFLINWKKGD